MLSFKKKEVKEEILPVPPPPSANEPKKIQDIGTSESMTSGKRKRRRSRHAKPKKIELPKKIDPIIDVMHPDHSENMLGHIDIENDQLNEEMESRSKDEINKAIAKAKKESIFKKILRKKPEFKLKDKFAPTNVESNSVQDLIKATREHLMVFDLEGAKKSYIELMKAYNSLNSGEQAEFYNDVMELYSARKSAESLKY